MDVDHAELLSMTAEIVTAHVTHNTVAVSDLPTLIEKVHAALAGLGTAPAAEIAESQLPAVSVRASIRPEYLVCLEDGKKLKMLKRYLRSNYQLTPDAYRRKWGLPSDYPMVAPAYRAIRSALALNIGLGKKPIAADAATPPLEPAKLKVQRKRLKITVE